MNQNDKIFVGAIAYAYNLTQESISSMVWNIGATFNPNCFDDDTAQFLLKMNIDEYYHDIRLSKHNIESFFIQSQDPFGDLLRIVNLTTISGTSLGYRDQLNDLQSMLHDKKIFLDFAKENNLEKSNKPIIEALEFDDEDEAGYFECSIPNDYPSIPVCMQTSFHDNIETIERYILDTYVNISMQSVVEISLIHKEFAIIYLFDAWGIMPINDTQVLIYAEAAEIIKHNQSRWITEKYSTDNNQIPNDIYQRYEIFISTLMRDSPEWKKVMAYFLAARKWKNPAISKEISYSVSNISSCIVDGSIIAVTENGLPSIRVYFDESRRDSKAI